MEQDIQPVIAVANVNTVRNMGIIRSMIKPDDRSVA
jgi:hypothetical protein